MLQTKRDGGKKPRFGPVHKLINCGPIKENIALEKFVITGGKPLQGEVTISGAKNAAVGILPATILAADVCVIENLPNISDVSVSLHILSALGAKVRLLSKNTYEIDTTHLYSTEVPDELSRQMRASYYFLGALLARFGKAQVAMPGGCNLGPRPIDQHLKAFSALGAEDSVDYGMIRVHADKLTGGHVFFDKVSVGATMNGMLSAVMADGQTVLENCAKEPHVVDLANFLNMCGADVRGAGTDVIKVRGVEKMHGCTYSIIPDQIEAGSYMVAAAATGGDVTVKNVTPKHLEPITEKLRRAGSEVEEFDDAVRVRRTGTIQPLKINTMPHPGFPTDMQPLMSVLLTVAAGTSTVTEGIWDNRFRYADELIKMGANIQVDGQVAVIEGVKALSPAPLRASDLRAGAALVVAALMAAGTSEIEEIRHIERGYEDIVEKLQGLGADIRKVERQPDVLHQAL
jgi:UDP-N-acetylglucosamine 1-carboxyvinyltransferase